MGRPYMNDRTGHKPNTPEHRLKSVKFALQDMGHASTCRYTSKGKPYLALPGGYRLIFFASRKRFDTADPYGNMTGDTYQGNCWTVAKALIKQMGLTPTLPVAEYLES